MKDSVVTANLGDFGWREIKEAKNLLEALVKQGPPMGFSTDEISIAFNKNSGYVFFTNSEYQVLALNGEHLEIFHNCPECGNEGFAEDIQWNDNQNLCGDCTEQ